VRPARQRPCTAHTIHRPLPGTPQRQYTGPSRDDWLQRVHTAPSTGQPNGAGASTRSSSQYPCPLARPNKTPYNQTQNTNSTCAPLHHCWHRPPRANPCPQAPLLLQERPVRSALAVQQQQRTPLPPCTSNPWLTHRYWHQGSAAAATCTLPARLPTARTPAAFVGHLLGRLPGRQHKTSNWLPLHIMPASLPADVHHLLQQQLLLGGHEKPSATSTCCCQSIGRARSQALHPARLLQQTATRPLAARPRPLLRALRCCWCCRSCCCSCAPSCRLSSAQGHTGAPGVTAAACTQAAAAASAQSAFLV
jgi:hypothetical protein